MKCLDRILGDDAIFQLEDRVLNAILFCSTVFGSIAFINDLTIQPASVFTLISFSVTTSFGCLYFLGRKKPNHRQLAFPYIIFYAIFITVIWQITGGITGPSLVYFVALIFIVPIITKGQKRLLTAIGLFVFLATLFFLEIEDPSIVQNIYNDPKVKMVDTFLTIIYLSILAFVVMSLVLFNYEKQKKKLEAVSQAKDKFFTIIAHDLRGPMASLINLGQMLLDHENDLDTEHKKDFIKHMYSSSQDIHHLLDNLLSWARNESEDLSIKPETINLITCIDHSSKALLESIRQKNIEFNVEIPGDHVVVADKNMLMTVIRNLLSNAIKFTHEGGQINISSLNAGDNKIQIKISDSGVGISREMQKQLFEINNILFSSGTKDEVGSGLGLNVCKDFIQKNNGEISLESDLQKGSTFLISLPTPQN